MKKLRLITILLALLILNPLTVFGFETDDFIIYKLFVHHFPKINDVRYGFPNFEEVLISENTGIDHSLLKSDEGDQNYVQNYLEVFIPIIIKKGMLEKLRLVNEKTKRFKNEDAKRIKADVIKDEKEKDIFSKGPLEDRWSNFKKEYGKYKGILTLSRISYTDNKNMALMNYSFICGSRCGGGGLVLLQKEDNRWDIMLIFPTWIS
jgi:hypothetical protein